MAVVYRHRRLDTNQIFYVGIGKLDNRPYSKANRNKWWKNIVEKTDCHVEIIQEDISWEDACDLECLLISLYGRKDLGTGILVNLTAGGEGVIGNILSEKTRLKMSNSKKGKAPPNLGKKASEESKKRMSISATGRKNSEESKEKNRIASLNMSDETKKKISETLKTKVRTDEWRESISKGKLASHSSASIITLDQETGVFYMTLKEVWDIFGYSRGIILRKLRGVTKNDTNLIIV